MKAYALPIWLAFAVACVLALLVVSGVTEANYQEHLQQISKSIVKGDK